MLPDKGDLDCARRRCFARHWRRAERRSATTSIQTRRINRQPWRAAARQALGAEALLSGGSRDEPRDARRPAPGHARLDLHICCLGHLRRRPESVT